MSDEWLNRFATLRPGLELGTLILAVLALLVLAPPTTPQPANHAPGVGFLNQRLDLESAQVADWQNSTVSIYDLPTPQQSGWLKWDNVDLDGLSGPLAVRTAGPFSAHLYWNGRLVGQKGHPADSATEESPGRIDAVFSIPPELIHASNNELLMHFSSHRAGYEPMTVIQALAIIPYRADDRRPLRSYFPLVLTGGTLLALALGIGWLGRTRRDPRAFYLALALTALFLAGGAEVSRAFVNYTYDWHQPRQAIMFGFLLVFGLAQLRYVITRWPTTGHSGLVLQAVAVISIAVFTLRFPGYDAQSTIAVATSLGATAGWLALYAKGQTRWLAGIFIIIGIYALRLPSDFLDRAVYALMLVLWGYLSLRLPDLIVPRHGPEPTQIKLITTGRMIIVGFDEIIFLKAAGNYTEVHLANGGQHLDNRSLNTLTDALPADFYRLHRSYAVNLAHVSEVRSKPGSKYTAHLSTGIEIPVSRKEVKTFREKLATTPRS